MGAVDETVWPMKQRVLLLIGFAFALLGYCAMPNFKWLPSIGVIEEGFAPIGFGRWSVISFLFISTRARSRLSP